MSIISSNIEGLSGAKQELLADLCITTNCDILCHQETHRGPTRAIPRVSGMTLIAERPHDPHGSAIFARNGLDANKSSLSDSNNIEVLSIDIMGITISSVYKPPLEPFDLPGRATDGMMNVAIGDFKSHSTPWGYREMNEDGEPV